MKAYQPKTGVRCGCRPGVQRDNCPACEGTGWRVDFAAIRARSALADQKALSLSLLEWHGGQGSSLYAVGSCMLSDSDRGKVYSPANHRGHDVAIRRAVSELRDLRKDAKHPECVTPKDEKDAAALADRLELFI